MQLSFYVMRWCNASSLAMTNAGIDFYAYQPTNFAYGFPPNDSRLSASCGTHPSERVALIPALSLFPVRIRMRTPGPQPGFFSQDYVVGLLRRWLRAHIERRDVPGRARIPEPHQLARHRRRPGGNRHVHDRLHVWGQRRADPPVLERGHMEHDRHERLRRRYGPAPPLYPRPSMRPSMQPHAARPHPTQPDPTPRPGC